MVSLKKLFGLDKTTPTNTGNFSLIDTYTESTEKQELPEELVTIVNDGFIDATSKENAERYSHNLAILIKKTKETGKVDKLKLIRNDDTLPLDWQWRVQSRDTQFKLNDSPLTRALRTELARAEVAHDSIFGSDFLTDAELSAGLAKIGKETGFILTPIGYRSTKHFTINTPLSHTHGIYNHCNSERNFTIIDDIDNFLNSGYAYSIHWYDAYLNVAHEGLSVSNEAVVLINIDKYQEIIQNQEIKDQLATRNVILFKGDEGLAINMFLSQTGALPARPGTRYGTIDDKTEEIMTKSLKALCNEFCIEYKVSHHTHFTDKLDQKSGEPNETNQDFGNFLKKELPEYASEFPGILLVYSPKMEELANRMVKEKGSKKILDIINKYNDHVLTTFKPRFAKYQEDRQTINDETRIALKTAFINVRAYYENHQFENYPEEEREIINNLIKTFFQGKTVQKQLSAAIELNNKLSAISEKVMQIV